MVNVLHIKNSKSKAYKHKKKGRIGKNCKYYNDEKHTCILSYKSFCKSDNCNCYEEKEHKIIKSDDDIVPLPIQAGTHERTNEYIKISKNIGTPCHVGYMKSNEPRRHKDINKAHVLLEGERWYIIETGQHKINRRDKRRCIY